MDMDDAVGWHFDTRGMFSVKSAYKVHRDSEIKKQRRHIAAGADRGE
jgi:hypothetical protein